MVLLVIPANFPGRVQDIRRYTEGRGVAAGITAESGAVARSMSLNGPTAATTMGLAPVTSVWLQTGPCSFYPP